MNSVFKQVYSELQKGMRLSKCRKCGCMRQTLENLKASLPSLRMNGAKALLKGVNEWLGQLEPVKYPCFGCSYCIPPEAMTKLTSRFPALASSTLPTCQLEINTGTWPVVAGEYSVLDKSAPVAVSVLSSTALEEKLVKLRPSGLCIVGKTETENIGIDKLIKNIITNPAIRFLIIAGKDPEGHHSGKTLLALYENGVDKNMRVIGSTGRRPILKNVTLSDVNKFRKQLQIENQIGCEDIRSLNKKIKELSKRKIATLQLLTCGLPDARDKGKINKIRAKRHSSKEIKLDKAGYFVIIPSKKDRMITVEHYSYDNKLLRTIEGDNSRDIYLTIISNNWITDLTHAAYLGKELARAELSIKKGFKYVQDGA
jgi:tetrahydromethanopterin S-methyltransferase subunit A